MIKRLTKVQASIVVMGLLLAGLSGAEVKKTIQNQDDVKKPQVPVCTCLIWKQSDQNEACLKLGIKEKSYLWSECVAGPMKGILPKELENLQET